MGWDGMVEGRRNFKITFGANKCYKKKYTPNQLTSVSCNMTFNAVSTQQHSRLPSMSSIYHWGDFPRSVIRRSIHLIN